MLCGAVGMLDGELKRGWRCNVLNERENKPSIVDGNIVNFLIFLELKIWFI